MPIDPATVSYVLSSIASAAKIIEFGLSLKGKPNAQSVAEAKRTADAYGAGKFGAASPAVLAISGGGWSKQVIEAIKKRIDAVTERSIQIINSDTFDDYDRSKRLRDQRRQLCALLNELRRYHGGTLPPDLEEEWQQTCSDYIP